MESVYAKKNIHKMLIFNVYYAQLQDAYIAKLIICAQAVIKIMDSIKQLSEENVNV
jgi:hypothetical protein